MKRNILSLAFLLLFSGLCLPVAQAQLARQALAAAPQVQTVDDVTVHFTNPRRVGNRLVLDVILDPLLDPLDPTAFAYIDTWHVRATVSGPVRTFAAKKGKPMLESAPYDGFSGTMNHLNQPVIMGDTVFRGWDTEQYPNVIDLHSWGSGGVAMALYGLTLYKPTRIATISFLVPNWYAKAPVRLHLHDSDVDFPQTHILFIPQASPVVYEVGNTIPHTDGFYLQNVPVLGIQAETDDALTK